MDLAIYERENVRRKKVVTQVATGRAGMSGQEDERKERERE